MYILSFYLLWNLCIFNMNISEINFVAVVVIIKGSKGICDYIMNSKSNSFSKNHSYIEVIRNCIFFLISKKHNCVVSTRTNCDDVVFFLLNFFSPLQCSVCDTLHHNAMACHIITLYKRPVIIYPLFNAP